MYGFKLFHTVSNIVDQLIEHAINVRDTDIKVEHIAFDTSA